MLREGPQPSPRARRAVRAARPRLQRRDQVLPAPLPRARSGSSSRPHVTGAAERRRRPPVCRARSTNLAVDGRWRRVSTPTGKLPRFRAVDLQDPLRARTDRWGPTSSTWPIDYDEAGAVLRARREPRGRRGERGREPVRRVAFGAEYPMPPRRPNMFGAVLTTEAAQRLGYNPYPAPTRA